MKLFMILFITVISMNAGAQNFNLVGGKATYEVKHTIKKVEGTSNDLKGKIQCKDQLCEFLIAVKINTFLSSDSNRDLNMQTSLDTSKYPIAIAKGKFNLNEWNKSKSTIMSEVDFHGIKKIYDLNVISGDSGLKKVDMILDLEAHKIERPSLFTIKIENTVPVHFVLNWKKEE